MVNAQITICLEKEIYLDAEGNEVLEKEAYGFAIDTLLTHANYLIFADETGCNTSQKIDGHTAGTKRIVAEGKVAMFVNNTDIL